MSAVTARPSAGRSPARRRHRSGTIRFRATLDVVYRWMDHTAEVELAIEAGDEREVFADALTALRELLDGGDGDDQRREVHAQARDRPALLAGWLEELVFLAETEGFVAARIVELTVTDDRVDAIVAGFIGNPPPLVKAVTYHRLRFDPQGSGFTAGVVLDV
jgi:SHS2 domain-containing protein